MEDYLIPDDVTTRASFQRNALSEINEQQASSSEGLNNTPKSTSPDEEIILRRGPRRKPITWSPYDYNKAKILGPPRDRTPEKSPSPRPDISSKLRRRLIMTPEKMEINGQLGESIANRLRSFTKQRQFNSDGIKANRKS